MDIRGIIKTALNGFLVYVQTDGYFNGENKKQQVDDCIAYFDSISTVNPQCLKNQPILNEALKLYKQTLADEFHCDSSVREEYRIVNTLIKITETIEEF